MAPKGGEVMARFGSDTVAVLRRQGLVMAFTYHPADGPQITVSLEWTETDKYGVEQPHQMAAETAFDDEARECFEKALNGYGYASIVVPTGDE